MQLFLQMLKIIYAVFPQKELKFVEQLSSQSSTQTHQIPATGIVSKQLCELSFLEAGGTFLTGDYT